MTATSPAQHESPGPLRVNHRRFRLLWIGETTSELGSSVASVALPLVALGLLGASALQVSVLSAAAWLPWLVIALPAGVWVDRFRRRSVMLTADLVAAALFVLIPILAFSHLLTVPLLVVLALAAGAVEVFFITAYRALLPGLIEPSERASANARLQGSQSAAGVLGPGVAGLLAQLAGAVFGVLVNAASFVVSAVCLLRMGQIEDKPRRNRQRRLGTEVREGLRFVIRDPLLQINVIYGGLSNLLLVGYESILLTFLVRTISLSSGLIGVLLACGQLGGILGAAVAGRQAHRIGTARFLLISKFVLAGGALLLPLTSRGPGLAFLVVGSAIVAAGAVAGNVVTAGFTQGYVPAALFGRVSTSMQVINFGAIPLGAIVGGTLATALGLRPAIWIMTGLLLPVAAILLIGPLRHYRDLPVTQDVPVRQD